MSLPPDANHPNRPTHPDFALLSKLAIARDEEASNGRTLPQFVSPIVDEESLFYMAQQRTMRALGTDLPPTLMARVMTVFYDGFLLGNEVAIEKTEDDS